MNTRRVSAAFRPYAALFVARFRSLIQYRTAAWAGVVTQIFFGFVFISLRGAFYKNAAEPPKFTYEQMVTYSWLVQALLALTPYTANPDPDIRNLIRSGGVAYELVRPLDLYNAWFARQIANRLAPTLLRCGPIFVLALLFFGMKPPPSAPALLAWIVATAGALCLIASLCALITITMLWTISGDGVARLSPTLIYVFSGQLVPLELMPKSLRPIADFLPFSGMIDAPFQLFLGSRPASDLGAILLHQAVWTLVFVAAGRFLLARGVRQMVVQGG